MGNWKPLHECCELGQWCPACETHHKLGYNCERFEAMEEKNSSTYSVVLQENKHQHEHKSKKNTR